MAMPLRDEKGRFVSAGNRGVQIVGGFETKMADLQKRAENASFKNIREAAFAIRQTAVQSVEKSDGPSPIGSPVHTHRGAFFRRAIRYEADKESAVIGPRHSVVGDVGETHEFGKRRKGRTYPARPTMGPALRRNVLRFGNEFKGSIG